MGIGNEFIKIGTADGSAVELEQKNPSGRNKSNYQNNKINDIKNNRGVALLDITVQKKVLVVLLGFFYLIFEFFDIEGKTVIKGPKGDKKNVLNDSDQHDREPGKVGEMIDAEKERGVKTETAAAEKPNGDNDEKGNGESAHQGNLVTDIVDFSYLIEGSFRVGHMKL